MDQIALILRGNFYLPRSFLIDAHGEEVACLFLLLYSRELNRQSTSLATAGGPEQSMVTNTTLRGFWLVIARWCG